MDKSLNSSSRKGKLLSTISNGLLMLCGMVGLTRTFLSLYPDLLTDLVYHPQQLVYSSFFTPVSQIARMAAEAQLEALPMQLTLWAIILALVSLAAWSLPKKARVTAVLVLYVLLTTTAFRYRLYLPEGAMEIAAAVYDPVVAHFGLADPMTVFYTLAPVDRFTGAVLFLGLVLAAIALLLGWAVIHAQRWWAAAFFTLLPVLPAMFTNAYPHWGWFILLSAFELTMLLGSLCRRSAGRGWLTLAALPATGLLLVIVVTALPQERYVYPQWAYRTWEVMASASDRWLPDISAGLIGGLPGIGTASGIRLDEVDLTQAGPLNYSGEAVFQIQGDYSGRVYLRGGSLAVYTGSSWEPLDEGAYDFESDYSPLLFPAQHPSVGDAHSLVIRNLSARTTDTFLPYQLADQNFRQLGLSVGEDSAVVSNTSRRLVEISFLPDALDLKSFAPSDDPDFLAAQEVYTAFVMEHYTQTDSDLLSLLGPVVSIKLEADYLPFTLFVQYPLSAEEYPNLTASDRLYLGMAQQVARWLAEQCVYDPDTPAVPEGQDFAEYFLTSGRGYCTHFATAAVLLLRELGVPARYVSGYVADPRAGQTVEVPDSAAHAWVEVYLPGYGWYPVEVTPGYDFRGPEVEDQPAETPSPSPSPTPSPTPSPRPSKDPPDLNDTPSPTPGGNGTDQSGKLWAALLKALSWVGGIAAAALLLWLGQYLPKRHRDRVLCRGPSNRAALACYGWLIRLTRWGGTVDPTALELARKARFSHHTLSEEERMMMAVLFHDERKRIAAQLSSLLRPIFRYLWGIPKQ